MEYWDAIQGMKSLVLVAASGSAWAVRTASLKPYKSDTSPNRPWCVDVPPNLSDTGKRQRKFFETEREAKAECETLKARRENFGVSLGTMTPARIAEAAEAYKLLDPLSVDLLTAVRDYTRRHHQLNASKPWKEVFDEYQKLPKHRSEKYQKELKDAGETMRPLDRKLVIEISPKNIQTVLWKFAPSTRNAKMRILRAVFNLGIKRGYLVENPINRLDFAELEKGEVETFTVDETTKLLTAAFEHEIELLPFLVLGFFCGIRPDGELQKLQWEHVHLKEKQVVIPPSVAKTKRRRFVDISNNALLWLKAYGARGGSFTGKIVPYEKSLLTKKRRALQEAAGVKRWIQQGMRHSYCSYWLAKHEDANKLVLQSGHTGAETMWEHYHRGTKKKEANNFWAIRPAKGKGNIVPMTRAA